MTESYEHPTGDRPVFGAMLQEVVAGTATGWFVLDFEGNAEVPRISYLFSRNLSEEAAQRVIMNQNHPYLSYRRMTAVEAQQVFTFLDQDEEGRAELSERSNLPDGE